MPFSPALPRSSAAGAVHRPPVAPTDVALAVLVLAVQAVSAAVVPPAAHSDRPDLLGWTLLAGSAVVLVWRRRAPMACMLGMVAFVALYHCLGTSSRRRSCPASWPCTRWPSRGRRCGRS